MFSRAVFDWIAETLMNKGVLFEVPFLKVRSVGKSATSLFFYQFNLGVFFFCHREVGRLIGN